MLVKCPMVKTVPGHMEVLFACGFLSRLPFSGIPKTYSHGRPQERDLGSARCAHVRHHTFTLSGRGRTSPDRSVYVYAGQEPWRRTG